MSSWLVCSCRSSVSRCGGGGRLSTRCPGRPHPDPCPPTSRGWGAVAEPWARRPGSSQPGPDGCVTPKVPGVATMTTATGTNPRPHTVILRFRRPHTAKKHLWGGGGGLGVSPSGVRTQPSPHGSCPRQNLPGRRARREGCAPAGPSPGRCGEAGSTVRARAPPRQPGHRGRLRPRGTGGRATAAPRRGRGPAPGSGCAFLRPRRVPGCPAAARGQRPGSRARPAAARGRGAGAAPPRARAAAVLGGGRGPGPTWSCRNGMLKNL